MSDDNPKASFWTTLPGVLSGAAALLTAIFAGYSLIRGNSSAEAPKAEVPGSGKPVATHSGKTLAASRCTVEGTWTVQHGNGAIAQISVTQDGSMLVGKGHEGKNIGAMRGTVIGRHINFNVNWSNQHTGVYTGVIDDRDRISGQNYDKTDPTSQTSWFIDDPDIMCATEEL